MTKSANSVNNPTVVTRLTGEEGGSLGEQGKYMQNTQVQFG